MPATSKKAKKDDGVKVAESTAAFGMPEVKGRNRNNRRRKLCREILNNIKSTWLPQVEFGQPLLLFATQ